MKQAKKSYINITDLVTAFHQEAKGNSNRKREECGESNKENRNINTRPSSQTSAYDTIKQINDPVDMLSKTLKIDRRGLHRNEERNRTHSKVSRPSIYQSLSTKPALQQIMREEGRPGGQADEKMQLLSNLMLSEKMFIDPDKWETFISKAHTDDKFHKALSAFLYSYFIHNYQ